MSSKLIQDARSTIRYGFWALGGAVVIAGCGKLFGISYLRTTETSDAVFLGAFGLLLLAQLIVNCTEEVLTEVRKKE